MCSVFIGAATESPQVGISAAVKTFCTIHGFSFVHMGLEQEIFPPQNVFFFFFYSGWSQILIVIRAILVFLPFHDFIIYRFAIY